MNMPTFKRDNRLNIGARLGAQTQAEPVIDQAILDRIPNKWSALENRAMKLLAAGTPTGAVADAVGVTGPRIGQLLAEPAFAEALAQLKSSRLLRTNELDAKYDSMESELADRLQELIPTMYKSSEVLHAISRLNQMKRRGAAHTAQGGVGQVVQITMPSAIINAYTQQNFTTNINNQVIRAGDQTLETVQSGTLLERTKNKLDTNAKEITHETNIIVGSASAAHKTNDGPRSG